MSTGPEDGHTVLPGQAAARFAGGRCCAGLRTLSRADQHGNRVKERRCFHTFTKRCVTAMYIADESRHPLTHCMLSSALGSATESPGSRLPPMPSVVRSRVVSSSRERETSGSSSCGARHTQGQRPVVAKFLMGRTRRRATFHLHGEMVGSRGPT